MNGTQRKKTSDSSTSVVFAYKPREFTETVNADSMGFIQQVENNKNDFKLSELITEQTAVSQVNQQRLAAKIEELVLDRLKDIQEEAYREAYELGRIEGSQRGFDEQKSYLENKLAQLDNILNSFDNVKQLIIRENEMELVQLVSQIASKIAMMEIKAKPESVIKVLETVTGDLQEQDILQIRMSHEDLLFIHSLKEKLGQKMEALLRVRIEAADDVDSGGCVVETPYGKMDANIRERIAKMSEAVENRVAGMAIDQLIVMPGLNPNPEKPKSE